MGYSDKFAGIFLAIALLCAQPCSAWAASPPAYDWFACQDEARRLEIQEGIPKLLLTAVTFTETGRRGPLGRQVMSWPWTLHAQGKSLHFDTKAKAATAVRALMAQGVKSIDVGCMQINLRYHPQAFTSVEEALDPRANLAYGVAYLKTLKTRHKGWPAAIQNYHSTNQAVNQRYRRKVFSIWDKLRLEHAHAAAQNGISRPTQSVLQNEIALVSRPIDSANLSLLGRREDRKSWTVPRRSSSLQSRAFRPFTLRAAMKPLPFKESRPHAQMIVALTPRPLRPKSASLAQRQKPAAPKQPEREPFNTVALFSHPANQ